MWLRLLILMFVSFDASAAIRVEGLQVEYAYQSPTQPLTIGLVQRESEDSWTKVSQLANYGFSEDEYWVRIKLTKTAPDTPVFIMRLIHPVLDTIDIHMLSASGENLNTWYLGDIRQNIQRPVQDKKPAFPVDMAGHQSVIIYIRVSSINAMLLTTEILSEGEHDLTVQNEVLLSGFIYGMLLVMALYNLGLAISTKDKAYYIYVLAVVAYVFFLLSILGLFCYFNHSKFKFLIYYLFFLSIVLELFHMAIPERTFQFQDLAGNILGVTISCFIVLIYKYWRKL